MRDKSSQKKLIIAFVLLIWASSTIFFSSDYQTDALYDMKVKLNASENQLSGWSQNQVNPCIFFGVSCEGDNVVTVQLPSLGFTGILSPRIGELKYLQVLSLQDNYIQGSIPSEFGNLSSLTSLNLKDNRLTGEIPDTLGNLLKLQSLDLSQNKLNGSIPNSFSDLSSLTDISLEANSLTGEVPTKLYEVATHNFSDNNLNCGGNFSQSCESSSSGNGGKRRRLIIIISVSVALLLIGCFIGLLLIRKLRYAETEISEEEKMLATNNNTPNLWSRKRSADSPLFDFNEIANATSNFALDNKLGEGGFGPVYKGVLQDGLEIAVKRLSTYSGQGLVEFNNEIQLIAKLQHRNLVQLVGWCIQGEEKILIYEFMSNKSLDYFIFDETRGALLNWERRFEIIEGIGQGLLYLHKHSRLRIVHRDLKASNILLDAEMNPKISDFGLARIFGPKELQANTNRVVGTHGYMAPEYASEGRFSMKSDIFSFGVLLLEIVSSKRNMGFHQYGHFLNLLGYAWIKWKDGSFCELICPTLTQVSQGQIERCIHVALLCVQENSVDRPIMSDVIMFLTTESIVLPEPKQPAYFNIRVTEEEEARSCSINYVTFTNPEVR